MEEVDKEFRSFLEVVWDYEIHPTQEEINEYYKEEINPDSIPFQIEVLPYLVRADQIVFEMPENW